MKKLTKDPTLWCC